MLPTLRISRPWVALLCATILISACGSQSADERLNQSLNELQEGIEARSTDRVMDLLHRDFQAKGDLDGDWARRTMTLMFLQNQRINVIVINQQTDIDTVYDGQAQTRAQVSLSGAERFIPDSSRIYTVTLDWMEEDGDWRLHRLNWE
jgi:outer membrane lipoprotein-sorting protein